VSLLALSVAGVRIDLRVAAPLPAGLERYLPFPAASGPPDWTIELTGPIASTVSPGRSLLARGGRWRIPGLEEAAWLDPATGTGAAGTDEGCLVLDTLLRAAVSATVLDAGGLLVHGASVVVDGAAHLCPARSGSGKSTLAARAGHPLADELSVLRPVPEGFRAHATPWWISHGGTAPLARIYELAWDGEGVTPLAGSALRLLSTNLVSPLDEPAHLARALAVAAEVARRSPFARLAFRRDSDVDALLRAAPRAVSGDR
jgi:hypothetical protein